MSDFDKAMPVILAHEGGDQYTNRKNDRGGPTRWGITQRTLSYWRGEPVSADAVAALTLDEARRIYRNRYWDKCQLDQFTDQLVATKVFDMAVNLGPDTTIELLQRAINLCMPMVRLRVDGWQGPKTIEATNLCDPARLLSALKMMQRHRYLEILAHDPTQEENRAGWLSRAEWPNGDAP